MNIKMIILSLILFLIPFTTSAQQVKSTYDIVNAVKSCKYSKITDQIECDYKIGKDLHINIAGIGMPDTGVAFLKSDFDGDFYAVYGTLHGCLIIKRGLKDTKKRFFDVAFISLKNGKVYKDWKTCESGD